MKNKEDLASNWDIKNWGRRGREEMHPTQERATLGTGRKGSSWAPQEQRWREKRSRGKWDLEGSWMAKENAGQAGGSGSNVENPAKREWGGVGEAVRPAGSRGWPPARTPPNSLTRVSAAAGRSAGRRAASPSRVVLSTGRRSLSLPSRAPPGRGAEVLFVVEGWGTTQGAMDYDSQEFLSALTRSGSATGGRRAASGRTSGYDAGMADRRVVRVAERKTVWAVAGGRSCPSGPASPEPLTCLRQQPAPSRAPARSEQSQ